MADAWQVAQNYVLFAAAVGGLGGYYYFYGNKPAQRGRGASRSERRSSITNTLLGTNEKASQSDTAKAKKKKTQKKPQAQPQQQSQPAPEITVQDEKPQKESDTSDAQFAQRMKQAKEGSKLTAPKSKEQRVKTVKQSSAQGTPAVVSSGSSQAGETGAEADDDLSPVASPAMNGGDVSDMLEPKASGPTSLRLTAPLKPERERKQKENKEQVVESKKARQNRKKVEERRLAREEEEKSRKALEEKQRRSAREARGEPAKNGIPVPKAPVNNPWEERNANTEANARSSAPANAASNGPLLDTFDASSTSSSVDGMKASTTATSESEDQQMARAVKESEDESGWTTVAVPKKQQKKGQNGGDATPQEAPKPKAKPTAPAKPAFNPNVSKPSGYAALNVDDPEAWEA